MENEKSEKRVKTRIRVLYILLGLCIALMAAFAIGLFLELRATRQGQSFYAATPVEYKPRMPQPAQSPVKETSPQEPPAPSPAGDDDDSDSLPEENVFIPFMDFDETRGVFPDLVAWIQSAGTVINYPVVQGRDNDYYLSRLPDLSANRMGSVFLDYRNAPDFSEESILIYGHNMKSEDIFGSLKNYRDQSYYDLHDSMYLFTPDSDYILVIIAGYILDSAYETPPLGFGDSGEFDSYIAGARKRSVFTSDAGIEYGDQIVFLCTCATRGVKSERFVLACKLVKL